MIAQVDPNIILVAILAPTILAILTAFINSRSKKAEWKRQDIVSDKLEARQLAAIAAQETRDKQTAEAASLLLAQQKETMTRTDEVARLQEEATTLTAFKLDDLEKIAKSTHTLVNSNMTAQMEDSLSSAIGELAALKEVSKLTKDLGHEPSQESLVNIELLTARVANKKTELADRMEATKRADKGIEINIGNTTEETEVK